MAVNRAVFMRKFRLFVSSFLPLVLAVSTLSFINAPTANAASGSVTNGSCASTVGETAGATIAQVGNDCVLTFTASSQTATSTSNSWTVPTGVREASVLVVAGGGAGGIRHGGGGGAGGLVYLENVGVVVGNTMAVTIGGGGAGAAASTCCNGTTGASGNNSTLTLKSSAVTSTTITAVGGGGGSGNNSSPAAGGSSGGSAYSGTAVVAANQSAQNYGYGNTGAVGNTGTSSTTWGGGGGGGAGGAGIAGSDGTAPGRGGLGSLNSITGTAVCYAAGGGGGVGNATSSTLTNGGQCTGSTTPVGGSGTAGNTATPGVAAANTGSGGGGGGFDGNNLNSATGSGAAGIVVIRWTLPSAAGAFPDIAGLSARFNANNFNTTLNGGLGTWADTSGSGYHIAGSDITGTAITVGTTGSNANGSNKSFTVVNGTSGSNMEMLSAAEMTGKYTLFTVARYSGASKNRIFQAATGNVTNHLSGFYNGMSGIYHKTFWQTTEAQPSDISVNNWLLSSECSYDPDVNTIVNSCSATYSANGKQRNHVTNTITSASFGIGINDKGYYTNQDSDFQIADVLVFNRVLTITEENSVEQYLSSKYGIGIYSDVIANYDPGDSTTTNKLLKNLGKGDGSLVDALDLTLYNNTLKSSENSGSLKFALANGSFGQATATMRPITRFSASSWFKQTGSQASSWNSIITGVGSTGNVIAPNIATYNNNVNAGFYDGANWSTGYANLNATAYPVSNDVWYHVTTTFDGINVRIYVNGVLRSTSASTANVLRSDTLLRLGSRWDGSSGDYGFNGAIGKTKIYDHALTDAEILAEYNADSSKYVCSSTTQTTSTKTVITFTNPGSCNWTAPTGVTSVRALLVGGGGGGGAWVGGGGGGGGVIDNSAVTVTPGNSYPIVIGGGGKGAYLLASTSVYASSLGSNSTALGLTAYGGGGGGTWTATGSSGATGGGGSYNNTIASSYTAQGFAGGKDAYDSGYGYPTGGGGGAGAVGVTGTVSAGVSGQSGAGGAGKASDISGTSTYYGGGGGGGCHGSGTYSCNVGAGGTGGGGGGAGWTSAKTSGVVQATSGTASTGGGGGGAGAPYTNTGSVDSQGGEGGSGVVVISYPTPPAITLSTSTITGTVGAALTGYTISNSGGAINSYSISPSLTDSGLTFSTSTGLLSGTPSAVATSTTYTVTATNGSGSSSATFSYVATLTTCSPTSSSSGGYTTLTFSTVQTCSWSVPSGVTAADVLVVGGGGGGSANWSGSASAGGSGGGGGVYTATAVPVSGSVNVTVGTGGANGLSTTTQSGRSGSQGGTSSFGTLTAGGGGGGGCESTATNGQPCGSGATIHGLAGTAGGNGGSPSNFWNAYNYGSRGTATSVVIGGTTFNAVNGNQGGIFVVATSTGNSAGSAGGAGGAGTYNTPGAGVTSSLTGSTVYGKGGSSWNASTWNLDALPANTGWGGNGGYSSTGAATNGIAGSSGVVVVKYVNAPVISLSATTINSTAGTAVTSYTISNSGGAAASYSISPSLAVSGLTFSTSTGQISGTPTTATSSATYTITATNTSGTSTATFAIASNYAACAPTSASSSGYTTLTFSSVTTCNWTTPTGITAIEVAVVGGGGGGGFGNLAGGGGAGEVLVTGTSTSVSSTVVSNTSTISTTPGSVTAITVGSGGTSGAPSGATETDSNWTAQSATATYGGNGLASSFGTITASGGGGGGGGGSVATTRYDGAQGGSGGGGASGGAGGAVGSASTLGWSSFKNAGAAGVSGTGNSGGGGAGGAGTTTRGGTGLTVLGKRVAGGGGGWGKLGSENSLTDTVLGGNGRLTSGNWGYAGTAPNYTSPGIAGTGTGGGAGAPGGSGVVVVRYAVIVNYTYDSNTGTGTAPAGGSAQGGTSFTTAANPFTRSGYTFSGWNTAANGSGTALTENASNTMLVSATSIVLYAQWTADTNNAISYNNQSATTAQSGGSTTYTTGSAISTIPTTAPQKTGYTFAGWFTAASGGTQVTDGSYTPPSPYGSVTLYAQWTALSTDSTLSALTISNGTLSPTFASATTTYTVSVANGTSSLTVTPTRNQSNATIQVKIGSGSYASVTSGSASGSLSLSVGTNAISVQVTAQDGSTTTYTVTVTRLPVVPTITKFDVQIMSANPSLVANKPVTSLLASNYSPTYSKYQSVQFTVNATTTDGGTLAWQIKEGTNCASSSTAISGATGLTINVMKSIQTYTSSTCYVVEVINTLNSVTSSVQSDYQLLPQYTSTPVGVNRTTTANNLSGKVGQAYSNSTPFSVSGGGGSWQYYFTNTVPAGLTINVNTGVISGTYTTVRDSYTGTYIVAIDANGGTASATVGPLTWSVAAGDALTPAFGTPTATADGFTVQISNYDSNFTWAGTASASGTVTISNTGLVTVTGVAIATSSTATITTTRSNYTSGSATVSETSRNLLTITFNRGANGTGSNQTLSKTFGTAVTLPNSSTANGYFTRAGYTVSAWSTTDGGSQTHTLAGSFTTDADTTLYPVWSPNTLTVTFDSQSGSAVSDGTVATNATLTAPTAPTRAGYTFSGWSTTSSGSVVSFSSGYTHGQTANFTLYAIWSANALTVTYDSKGGSSVSSGTVNTAASISSAPTEPTRAGYSFSAWSATDGGTAITFPYAHGQTANFTLYALWTANSLTVTYNSKGGTSVTSGTVNTGASITSAPTAPTKTGYTLDGWSLTDGGTLVTFPFAHAQTANFTLYAKWTGTTNTITYDSKGGSSVANGSFVTGGSISAAPTAPTRAGYTLSGWSETDGGSVITYPFSPTATSGITLYAIWAGVSCSPTSTTTGGYTIYTFTTAGTCFWTVPNGVTDVEVLAVAGGAGGGYSYDNSGAGGGAGGQVKTGILTLSTTAEVTVGAGGTGGTASSRRGGSGGNSSISTISALGGKGGCGSRSACATASQATSSAAANGGAGGSGGASGKGGGGSNTTAAAPTTVVAGAGTASTYSGSSVTYGAGGAGGTARGNTTNIVGTDGSANTGNGGGGASAKSSSGDVNGGAGGTGLVIVRIASTLTVSFDSQSGSSVSDTSTVTAGVLSEPTAPTRSNYTFVGWFTATSGGSAITFPYTHGQTANFTLYARWSLNSYAIAFNANNGSGTMANQSVTHGVAANLSANLFTRANYVFYRWATNANGTGTTYDNLAQVTLTAGTTLYAQWTANTYVVTYSYNNATGGNSTTTSSFTTGGSVIVLPTPTRTGYTFGGWYSDSGLSNQIGLAGADYSPTGTTLSLNAYAKWTAIDYTFTYNGNSSDGGSVPTETSKQIGQTATVKANTGSLTRAGYTFAGWNTQSNGSGDNYLSGSSFTVQSSNVTLYAKWTANSYTITYNSNGGTGSAQRSSSNISSDTYTTGGSSVALPGVGTLERTGYTFGGWNTSAAGTGTNRSATDTYTTVSDVIFYAKWNPVTYSITYDGNTSTGGTNPTTGGYTTGQASPYSVATNTFTKTLHVFGGWNTAANGTGTNYSSGSPVTTLSDITLYAIWIPQYTLHYAINGGSVSSGSLPSDQLYNANTSVGPVFSSVSRTGYTFGGWRNGSSTIAAAGSFTIVEDSVLTAIWTPIDYTISYDSDGGTTPPNSFTKQIGQSFEVGSAVSKPGYNFTGWKAGSTTVGAGATIVVGSANISYTAQWTAKVYRISYDWNGGRGTAVSDVDYTFGTTAITLPLVGDRVKDGYNFAGWAESTDGSALGLTYTPSQTRTLYALWTLGNFTVTYDAGRGTVANSTVAVQNGSSTVLPLPTRSNFVFNGWHTAVTGGSSVGSNGASFTPAASQTVYARWIQTSIYGITDSLSRIGSVITTSNVSNTFSGANSNSSVSVSIPANALPAGTTINFDLVGNSSRAVGVLPNVSYLVSIALSWLTGDETVPDTASDKPITVTISNATIKAGAAAYAIVNNVSTLLGTATEDGTITISITSDPEIVVAATKPGAPTNISATSNGNQQSVISWSAPSSNGGAEITGYTVTSNTGATCTTSGTSCTISSLTNGTAYTFTVAATNSVGTGVASSSASATTASLYSVTFDAKGGSAVSNGSFLTASTVSEPTAPTRSGYSFAGWSASDGGSVEVFPYAPVVTSNITMYAKWDALDNAVTFDAKGGSSVTATVFASGGTVAEPTAPTRSGYTFAGWSATDGGSAITFPYAPGVVTDITLYARWTAASSGGGGGGSSSSSSGSSNSSSNSSNSGGASTSANSNVTIVAPVTVVGDKDAKVTSVDIKPVSTEAGSKPPAVKVDSVSDKFIAEVKIVDGKLVLTPETGFSGKKTVTVTITENGVDRIIQIPLTVLPEAVEKPVLTPTASNKSIIRWTESPNATAYTVLLNGKKVCSTSASSCSVKQVLGPDAVIEVISNGGDRTVSEKIEADFRQNNPVAITRLVSATITKATLTKVDTKALDKVIALIRTQGFATVVISEITTTKKTATLAAARIAAIKKYIDEKTGSREITFEVVPAASRTYFNNISVKG